MANYYLIIRESYHIVDRVDSFDDTFEVHEDMLWIEGPDIEEGLTTAEYQCSETLEVTKSPPPDVRWDLERRANYPTINEQLDLIYHNGIDQWRQVIKQVKDTYPKPPGQ